MRAVRTSNPKTNCKTVPQLSDRLKPHRVMGTYLEAPLKILPTHTAVIIKWFQGGSSIGTPMVQRYASLPDGCTPDHCRIGRVGPEIELKHAFALL